MFPHTVTVVNIVDGNWHKEIVEEVFYYSDKIVSLDGKAEKYVDTHTCIFSNQSLKEYRNISDYKDNFKGFTLQTNDLIVKGKISDINDIRSLQKSGLDYFSIKTISKNNDFGSVELRNIEVTD